MKHNERFGALRALLQQPPSATSWKELCTITRGFAPEAFVDHVEQYTQDMLRRWPAHLRVTPRGWARDLIRGKGFGAIRLCRHLDLSRFVLRSEQLTMLLRSQKHMGQMSVLNLNGAHITPGDLRVLYRHPALQHVDDLRAEFDWQAPRSGFSSQHELSAMLPLKKLTVHHTYGLHEYLRSSEAQRLSHFKMKHWLDESGEGLLELFKDVALPDLDHLSVETQGFYSTESPQKIERYVDSLALLQGRESTWLRCSLEHCAHDLARQRWSHTKDLIVLPRHTRDHRHLVGLLRTLSEHHDSTRVHTSELPAQFSWVAASSTLETLRARHNRGDDP